MVLFCPVLAPVNDPAVPATLAKPDWHAFTVWQTLQPVPVQPSSQEQPEDVKLAKGDPFAKERPEPWKMVPPQAGWEHVEPPKPGGQAQDVPLGVP